MAQPITLDLPPSDPVAELQERLQNAPIQHAQAILAALDLLQALHDSGTIDLLRGALGSKDKVLNVAVGAAASEEGVRAIGNLVLILNMLSAIDPKVLRVFTETLPAAMKQMVFEPEAPGLWRLLRDFFWNPDFRHGLAAINTMFEVFGRAWNDGKSTVNHSQQPRDEHT
jgi:uncharacterized protein YjgD (DUF1641 family)